MAYRDVPGLTSEALFELRQQPWPGNIRELRHVMKGAALRAGGGPIDCAHLDLGRDALLVESAGESSDLRGGADGGDAAVTWKERLERQEKEALQRTLAAASGNLTRAAELFGVPRTTYREKLQRHGLLEG